MKCLTIAYIRNRLNIFLQYLKEKTIFQDVIFLLGTQKYKNKFVFIFLLFYVLTILGFFNILHENWHPSEMLDYSVDFYIPSSEYSKPLSEEEIFI